MDEHSDWASMDRRGFRKQGVHPWMVYGWTQRTCDIYRYLDIAGCVGKVSSIDGP